MNKTHRKNLKKLADYLWDLPRNYNHFDMGDFCVIDDPILYMPIEPHETSCGIKELDYCGTAACAAGHGPSAGIKARKDEDWRQYVGRVFGCGDSLPDDGFEYAAFEFLFDSYWNDVDNTPKGAAKRIYYFLENGLPSKSDVIDMQSGKMSLCYTKMKKPK